MADRFRGVVRGGLGGEELAERTRVREQAPQTARVQRAADRKRGASLATSGHSGPQSGPRDRYDRASLIAKLHAAPVDRRGSTFLVAPRSLPDRRGEAFGVGNADPQQGVVPEPDDPGDLVHERNPQPLAMVRAEGEPVVGEAEP